MDGNGRWAKQRKRPRIFGHRAGVESVRGIITKCAEKGVEVLTLFAFSSENWRRPKEEVGLLMELFLISLEREVSRLHKNNVRLKVIGDRLVFNAKLQRRIAEAEEITRDNDGLTLVIAANYGGRWDITQAVRQIAHDVETGALLSDEISDDTLSSRLSLSDLPEPDLFIRTGGEQRISNYLLWQLAYTEFYFTDTLWPDFDDKALEEALSSFVGRQRRFGRTGDQVEQEACSNSVS
jgi:undecaprenyl diphosphate synthase